MQITVLQQKKANVHSCKIIWHRKTKYETFLTRVYFTINFGPRSCCVLFLWDVELTFA